MNLMKFINKGIMKNSQTKTIYFLDRNIISVIKDRNSGKAITDENKKNILDNLNKIDCSSSIVTPILSLIEGRHGRLENVGEIPDTVKSELAALEIFFKKAKVDKSFESIYQLFEDGKCDYEYKGNIQDKIEFLQEVNEYLYQPLPEKCKLYAKKEIVRIQEEKYGKFFDKFNPVVVASLCCLYGNQVCKKILKPKKDIDKSNYYNAVMDFQHFTMFAMLVGQIEGVYSSRHKAKIHCKFLSGDKSLNEFFSWYEIYKSSSSLADGEIKVNLVLSTKGIENIPEELKDVWDIKK